MFLGPLNKYFVLSREAGLLQISWVDTSPSSLSNADSE